MQKQRRCDRRWRGHGQCMLNYGIKYVCRCMLGACSVRRDCIQLYRWIVACINHPEDIFCTLYMPAIRCLHKQDPLSPITVLILRRLRCTSFDPGAYKCALLDLLTQSVSWQQLAIDAVDDPQIYWRSPLMLQYIKG